AFQYGLSASNFETESPYLSAVNPSLNKVQFQGMIGFGAHYRILKTHQLSLQMRYHHGLGQIHSTNLFQEQHHYLSFRLGWNFGLSKKKGGQS
ncbi:MAG: hypothetical protein LPK45_07015, partial [Bacteroidota bacterium]|nr:hypothetical protein [Bacteroidota bacterium]MDX5430826.1 hypothetical protein [Bacteroidota bacterium]MDX5469570.1 hypothetical protein [Bacteroidota bacterium]